MSDTAGRRERNKSDKQSRIFAAAAELFAASGYDAVTTQQIAEQADVANGTVFRYASTKAELLLMVMNEDFRARVSEGRAGAASIDHSLAAQRILALLTPAALASCDGRENTSRYQRELLFGEPTERFRAEGLAIAHELQDNVADILRAADTEPTQSTDRAASSTDRPRTTDRPRAQDAARAIANIFHLEISRAALERTSPADLLASIERQVNLISSGYLRSRHPENPDAPLTESPMKEEQS